MGYLTHLSIYNDGIDLLKSASEEDSGKTAKLFCNDVYRASLKATCYREEQTFGVSVGNFNFANLVNVHIPVHADDPVLYLNIGNSLVDLSVDHKTVKYMSVDYLKKCVKTAKMLVKELEMELKSRK